VRGTVRSVTGPKTAFLHTLAPGAPHKLELVQADLNSDAGWEEAVRGATYILHVASPFPMNSPKVRRGATAAASWGRTRCHLPSPLTRRCVAQDLERDLYGPAIEGTKRVLRFAAAADPRPRRVVVTSSTAAIAYGHDGRDPAAAFTDTDWSDPDSKDPTVVPYIISKTRAERAAWEYVASLPADKRFEMATINPTTVIGPLAGGNDCTRCDGGGRRGVLCPLRRHMPCAMWRVEPLPATRPPPATRVPAAGRLWRC
jgi:dihydroflavonol-4-reductase